MSFGNAESGLTTYQGLQKGDTQDYIVAVPAADSGDNHPGINIWYPSGNTYKSLFYFNMNSDQTKMALDFTAPNTGLYQMDVTAEIDYWNNIGESVQLDFYILKNGVKVWPVNPSDGHLCKNASDSDKLSASISGSNEYGKIILARGDVLSFVMDASAYAQTNVKRFDSCMVPSVTYVGTELPYSPYGRFVQDHNTYNGQIGETQVLSENPHPWSGEAKLDGNWIAMDSYTTADSTNFTTWSGTTFDGNNWPANSLRSTTGNNPGIVPGSGGTAALTFTAPISGEYALSSVQGSEAIDVSALPEGKTVEFNVYRNDEEIAHIGSLTKDSSAALPSDTINLAKGDKLRFVVSTADSFDANRDSMIRIAPVIIYTAPPIAFDSALAVGRGQTCTGTFTSTDINVPALEIAGYELVDVSNAHGTVTLTDAAAGTFTYTHDDSDTTSGFFTFRAKNTAGAWSDPATVIISIDDVIAFGSLYDYPSDKESDGSLQGAFDVRYIPTGATVSYQVTQPVAGGTVTVQQDGTFTFTADDAYYGDVAFDYTVTVNGKDYAGTITILSVNTKVPVFVTTKYQLDDTAKTICKIDPSTSVDAFLGNIVAGGGATVKLYEADGNTEVTEGTVGTGMVVKVLDGSSTVYEYAVVIYGDVDGDGNVTALDMAAIKKHILGKSKLTGTAFTAADIDGDSKVNTLDMAAIKRHILQIAIIDQTK